MKNKILVLCAAQLFFASGCNSASTHRDYAFSKPDVSLSMGTISAKLNGTIVS